MKPLFIAIALFLLACAPAGAACPDGYDDTDLPEMLARGFDYGQLYGEIIAVVKGRFQPVTAPRSQETIASFHVTRSYGLIIPPGRYRLAEDRFWGPDCASHEESAVRYDERDAPDRVSFLALKSVHGGTLVVPMGTARLLALDTNQRVVFSVSDTIRKTIDLAAFESHLLQGIGLPSMLWRTEFTE